MSYSLRNASRMSLKSCSAFPVRYDMNSRHSCSVARSFLMKTGRAADLRPAPSRLPPWVDLLLFKFCQFLLALFAVRLGLIGVFILSTGSVRLLGFGGKSNQASELSCSVSVDCRCVFHVSSFLIMKSVYQNQDSLSRGKI
jgi:hypothetical protein